MSSGASKEVLIRGRFSRKEDIIRGEGRALVLAVRHALRARRNLGAVILILRDNLSLTLAVQNGARCLGTA